MNNLPDTSSASKNSATDRCVCGAEVIRAGSKLVERCAAGAGDVALTQDLVTKQLTADRVRRLKTSFKFHVCPTAIRSFSADAIDRKKANPAQEPSISYRSFGAKRRSDR